jgi:hypothetical protein
MICLERRIEINFHLNLNLILILNYEACKLSERFLKFALAIFPAKVVLSFGLIGSQLA